MDPIIVLLFIVVVVLILFIFYWVAWDSLKTIEFKIEHSDNAIRNLLANKKEMMDEILPTIRKATKDKDYFKSYDTINIDNTSTYELDELLDTNLELMERVSNDYKPLKTKTFAAKIKRIKDLNLDITANKRYFNKNNNLLIKELKGYKKLVAKLHHIKVRNLYETKEPIETNQ